MKFITFSFQNSKHFLIFNDEIRHKFAFTFVKHLIVEMFETADTEKEVILLGAGNVKLSSSGFQPFGFSTGFQIGPSEFDDSLLSNVCKEDLAFIMIPGENILLCSKSFISVLESSGKYFMYLHGIIKARKDNRELTDESDIIPIYFPDQTWIFNKYASRETKNIYNCELF